MGRNGVLAARAETERRLGTHRHGPLSRLVRQTGRENPAAVTTGLFRTNREASTRQYGGCTNTVRPFWQT